MEMKEFLLRITFRWSSFNPNICNNIEVEKVLKGRCYDFKLFTKKQDFMLCKDMYAVKIVAV